MLFKKSLFLLPCILYSAVNAAPVESNVTTTQWTGQELELYNLLNKPHVENGLARTYHKDNTSLSGYEQDGDVEAYFVNCSPEWVQKGWDFTIQIWDKWGNNDKENAKTCINMLITAVKTRCGSNLNDATAGQCYCGSFFGDKVNGPGVAEGAMADVKDNIDRLGIPKTGYVASANINGNRDERFGIAVNCNSDQSWVSDKLTSFSANRRPSGEYDSTSAYFYGAIQRMTT